MTHLSRRQFVALTATGIAATSFAAEAADPITAEALIERIRAGVGVDWNAQSVDTFKAGNPATPVRGVATTTLATLPVLRQAVARGANLIVTSGPTFHSRNDAPSPGRRGATSVDPIFQAKADFIRDNGLVVWRFSDHWRQYRPDPFARGLVDALGWTRRMRDGDARVVQLPETSVDRVVGQLDDALNARGGMRVIGSGRTRVRTIALLPGTTAIRATVDAFAVADVVVAGEVREWESVEYVRDLVATGEKKAMILLGRVLSEERGMQYCAQWLRTLAPGLAVTWLPAGDPYWRPA